MDYSGTASVQGDGQKALEHVRLIFMKEGYEVSTISSKRIEVSGGSPLNKKNGPLHGVSRAVFQVSAGSLLVEADLGGIRKLRNFLILFLPGLGLFLAIAFLLSGVTRDYPAYMAFVFAFLPLAPWVVVGPAVLYFKRRGTIQALETLLKNLGSAANE